MTWRLFTGSDSEWDQVTSQLSNPSPYQTHAWARFRSHDGWSPIRLTTLDQAAMVQVLTRKVFGIDIAWVPGGPLGQTSTEVLMELGAAVRRQLSANVFYMRIADFREANPLTLEHYLNADWRRPRATLSTGKTLVRALPESTEGLRISYTKNWSRNLRRGEDRGVTASVWTEPNVNEIVSLHLDVANIKGLNANDWRTSTARLTQLLEYFRDQVVIVRAIDGYGVTQAIRGAVKIGSRGFDFLAATSVQGRSLYASNIALHHLLETLCQQGILTYDFGGVDRESNKGVYDFKHGAGGSEYAYVGEFEAAHPSYVRSILSTLMALRVAR